MSAKQPEVDVAASLAAAGLGTVGTSIFYGPPRSPTESGLSSAALWVHPFGGPPPDPFLAASQSGSFFAGNVQVWTLSAPGNFEGGIVTARAVRDALHTKAPAGYAQCLVLESEPNYLGRNEAQQHRWTSNFRLRWQA